MLEIHPLADIFPEMSDIELGSLADDIAENGVLHTLVLYEGKILDGRHRYWAAQAAGIDPADIPTRELPAGTDPVSYVVSTNIKRRHLDETQRSMIAGRLPRLQHGQKTSDEGSQTKSSLSERAAMLNVGTTSVKAAEKVLESGAPELIAAVDAGEVSVSDAAKVAGFPHEAQVAVLEAHRAGSGATLASARKLSENAELAAQPAPDFPQGKYATIVIDPPWQVDTELPYPTMSLDEIAELDLPSLAADDCWLFLWTLHKYHQDCFRLLDRWGFRYRWQMIWGKDSGRQFQGTPATNYEGCIIASKGAPRFATTKDFALLNQWPTREHSEKPIEFYELLARVTPAPRIDIFGRTAREGFEGWGKEYQHNNKGE